MFILIIMLTLEARLAGMDDRTHVEFRIVVVVVVVVVNQLKGITYHFISSIHDMNE
jgi:hypothetical protein